jgi:hypothetical protein
MAGFKDWDRHFEEVGILYIYIAETASDSSLGQGGLSAVLLHRVSRTVELFIEGSSNRH